MVLPLGGGALITGRSGITGTCLASLRVTSPSLARSAAKVAFIHRDSCLVVKVMRDCWAKRSRASCISSARWKRSSALRDRVLKMICSTPAGMLGLSPEGWGTMALRTFSRVASSLSPWNRRLPVTSSNSVVPRAKMSERPSMSPPSTCSGDM